MSRFSGSRLAALTPYVPGEQPQDKKYIKLNTNEAFFRPCPGVFAEVGEIAERLRRYNDPAARELVKAIASSLDVKEENVIATNGSDEALAFAFMAFCDEKTGVVFPDVTYGFYPVFAAVFGVKARQIALKEDFTLSPEDYFGSGATVVIANPNAQTGIALPPSAIEEIVKNNPQNVVVVDEAYVDFGASSCVPLTKKYDNLLVVRTMSKSGALAGARVGYCVGNRELIADLNTIKYSFNPYNVGTLAQAVGAAAAREGEYYAEKTAMVRKNRDMLCRGLDELKMSYLPSLANFVLAKAEGRSGEELYRALKERGVLVRHFGGRIADYIRITIGSSEEMKELLCRLKEIL